MIYIGTWREKVWNAALLVASASFLVRLLLGGPWWLMPGAFVVLVIGLVVSQ